MAKRKPFKPPVNTREALPLLKKDGKESVIMCPFCVPSHPLKASTTTACGTRLKVTAVQTIYNARNNDKMVCVKCGEGGKYMVRTLNAFAHTHDCKPGTVIFTEAPKYSRFAKLIYHCPKWLKDVVRKRYGEVKPLHEVDQDSQPTGKILGYFFLKEARYGKKPEPDTG